MSEEKESRVKLYMMVFGALMVLTCLTVGVSYVHFPPPWGLVLGLSIAALKASLVASIFMHLKWEKPLIYGVLGLTAVFVIVLFTLPIIDQDSEFVSTNRVHVEAPVKAPVPADHGGHH